jgi:hypothetical protein
MDQPVSVQAKGKNHNLQTNSSMSVALSGTEAPDKTASLQGHPDNWITFDQPKQVTSDQPNTPAPENKDKAKPKSRRKK